MFLKKAVKILVFALVLSGCANLGGSRNCSRQSLNTCLGGENGYAILVGSNYDSLTFPEKAVERMSNLFCRQGYQVVTLTGKNVTEHNLIGKIEEIAKVSTRKNNSDRLIFYYIGHGNFVDSAQFIFDLPNGDWILKKGIEEIIQVAKNNQKIVILDACFSGLYKPEKSNAIPAVGPEKLRRDYAYMQITTYAGETLVKGLSKALLDGLNGKADFNKDSDITAGELARYLETRKHRFLPSHNMVSSEKLPGILIGDSNMTVVSIRKGCK